LTAGVVAYLLDGSLPDRTSISGPLTRKALGKS
jgi:hypothetical protein